MANVTVLDHPLIQHKLAILRSKTLPSRNSGSWLVKSPA